MSCMPPTRDYIILDGMRGIAAIAVATFHANLVFGVPRWFPSGYLAVDLFFVLSGFVLAHAYERRFAEGMTPGTFMRARLIRLYPLYGLALTLYFVSLLGAHILGHNVLETTANAARALPWNGFFLPLPQSNGTAELFPINPPAWTLFFELLVNLAFALSWPWLTTRRLLAWISVDLVALAVCGLYFNAFTGGWNWSTFLVGFARAFYGFPVGVLLYRQQPLAEFIPSWLPLTGSAVVLLIPYGAPWLVTFSIIAIIMPTLVLLGSRAKPRMHLTLIACSIAGLASYAIYVLHQILLFPFFRLVHFGGGYTKGALFTIGIFVVAILFDRYYDQPTRRWLTRNL